MLAGERRLAISFVPQDGRQPSKTHRHTKAVGAEDPFVDGECSLMQLLSAVQLIEREVDVAESVKRTGQAKALLAQDFLGDG